MRSIQGQNSATIVLKTSSKEATQKTAEAAGDLVGNKIFQKVTKAATKNNHEDPRKYTTITQMPQATNIPEEICIPTEKRQKILNELQFS